MDWGGCQHRRFLGGGYLDFPIEGKSIKNDWLNRPPSFFSLHVDNYGNVSQFHAGKTFLLHISYVLAHTCFYMQGECYFLRLLQTSSGGRVRSENR